VRNLGEAFKRSCGCPITGSVQGQVGWGFEQLDLVKDILAHRRWGWKQMIFNGPFQPKPFYDSMILSILPLLTDSQISVTHPLTAELAR